MVKISQLILMAVLLCGFSVTAWNLPNINKATLYQIDGQTLVLFYPGNKAYKYTITQVDVAEFGATEMDGPLQVVAFDPECNNKVMHSQVRVQVLIHPTHVLIRDKWLPYIRKTFKEIE